jgi:hypothetical protein
MDIFAPFYHRAISQRDGLAFSLNISRRVIGAAKADKRGFCSHVRRRVDRTLKRKFGRPVGFWFVVQSTPDGRPHLHGGIAIDHNDLPDAADALKHAGGTWLKANSGYQVHFAVRHDDDWARYALRGVGATRRHISGSLLAVTNDIRSIAKALYADGRRKVIHLGSIGRVRAVGHDKPPEANAIARDHGSEERLR